MSTPELCPKCTLGSGHVPHRYLGTPCPQRPEDAEWLQELASLAALARLDARKGENTEEWAAKLAEDLSKFKD